MFGVRGDCCDGWVDLLDAEGDVSGDGNRVDSRGGVVESGGDERHWEVAMNSTIQ